MDIQATSKGGFSLWGVGVPRSASCGVCVSRLVRFAGASGLFAGFNARDGLLAWRLLGQGCRFRKTRGAFFCILWTI